jgi:hypothetical protein
MDNKDLSALTEGKVKKGGVNTKMTMQRPVVRPHQKHKESFLLK